MATNLNFFQIDKKKKLSLEVSEEGVNFSIWKREEIHLSIEESNNLLNFLQAELLRLREDAPEKTTQDLANEIAENLLNKKVGGFIYRAKEKS